VRFDPLPAERIAAALGDSGVEAGQAEASARLALGNAARARFLASDDGMALRADVEVFVRDALAGGAGEASSVDPWQPLLTRADRRGAAAQAEVAKAAEKRLEIEPKGRERRALERDFEETAKRDGRRARTEMLELGLELSALAFRDLGCLADGVPDVVLATDRADALAAAAHGRDGARLREAVELCEETRLSLEVNVTEELALSALSFRLRRLVGSPG